jgi:hypothetical protein
MIDDPILVYTMSYHPAFASDEASLAWHEDSMLHRNEEEEVKKSASSSRRRSKFFLGRSRKLKRRLSPVPGDNDSFADDEDAPFSVLSWDQLVLWITLLVAAISHYRSTYPYRAL